MDAIEADGGLLRVTAPVDPQEELAAATYMVAQDENSPALLFENLEGDATGTRILSNMLGASNRRYALAVGLDPDLPTGELILATRERSKRTLAPVDVPADTAPVNEIVLTGDDIDLNRAAGAAFLATRWREIYRDRRYYLHQKPRFRAYQCRLLSPDAARPTAGRDVLLARQARLCSIAKPGGNAARNAKLSLPMASTPCRSWSRRNPMAVMFPNSTSLAG